MNLPNKITMLRILLVPLFLVFILPIPESMLKYQLFSGFKDFFISYNIYIHQTGIIIGCVIFIIASATDGIDGYIARKNNLVTPMGKFLDPIADKLLVTAALLALVQTNTISSWIAVIIIGREFIVTGFRLIAVGEGKIIAAGNLGKIKTVFQMIAIPVALLDNWLTYNFQIFGVFPFYQVLFFIAVILTIVSGYEYIAKNFDIIANMKDS